MQHLKYLAMKIAVPILISHLWQATCKIPNFIYDGITYGLNVDNEIPVACLKNGNSSFLSMINFL